MSFDSLAFLLFFPIVYLIYWRLATDDARRNFLCAASLFFYACWDYRYIALIVFVTAVAYWTVAMMVRNTDLNARKRWLALGATLHLSALFFFKYVDFFLGSLNGLAQSAGFAIRLPLLEILLPVGISFYTFHAISYTVDVYRQKVDAETHFAKLLLYLSFFPQLVAGPIVRASFFLPQIRTTRSRDLSCLAEGLRAFAIGFVFKTVLADNLSQLADPVFAEPEKWSSSGLWVGALAYYGQIYFDFAGYSLMAIGVALWFGYRLPENFAWPYTACSVTEFWRRWHISLSSFLRDYLYIPLGGNQGGRWRQYRNLFVTMLLGGLWHGASWNFIIWGALHGAALVAHKVWCEFRDDGATTIPRLLFAWMLTQAWVLIAWIFFRAESFEDAIIMFRGMLIPVGQAAQSYPEWLALFVVAPIAVDAALGRWKKGHDSISLPPVAYAAAFGMCAAAVLWLRPLSSAPFIYFQF